MLNYSGKLLLRSRAAPYREITSGPDRLVLPGFSLEPLFTAFQATRMFDPDEDAPHWFVALPEEVGPAENPWDAAHRVAGQRDYTIYAEPDLLHERRVPEQLSGGLNGHWPPWDAVSPGWHLDSDHAGFEAIRSSATGQGMRIAHLDTGYCDKYKAKPRYLRPEIGWNVRDDNDKTKDTGKGPFAGHGPATMAVLAGNHVDLTFSTIRYTGDLGGAPDAEVVPVLISSSVIHLFTVAMARGIDYAIAPRKNPANRCDVVTISHGGLPTLCWAAAVNKAYRAGIVIVAASGDNFYFGLIDILPHDTIWPSRFDRVITAVGATYEKKPYVTYELGVMQGSWGPPSIMRKAVAAFTPNVAWMLCEPSGELDTSKNLAV